MLAFNSEFISLPSPGLLACLRLREWFLTGLLRGDYLGVVHIYLVDTVVQF